MPGNGWPALFSAAFTQSRNAMVLVDDRRRMVDVNGAFLNLLGHRRTSAIGRPIWSFVVDGPVLNEAEWAATLADGRATGAVRMRCADGREIGVQWGATTELVTGRRLVLFVALSTSRWGARFRRAPAAAMPDHEVAGLSQREGEIVHLVAEGRTAAEIGDELHISANTVRTHVRNAMDKLGARSRAQLVAKAMGLGLVPI